LYLTQFLSGNLALYGRVLKSVPYLALVRKAADEITITIFSKYCGGKKINERLVTSKKLTNNFTDVVTCGLETDMAREPLALPRS
jgi:hypothetical protein